MFLFGKTEQVVPLSYAGGLLQFNCVGKYKVGKTIKVKLTLVYGQTMQTPTVSVLLVTVDSNDDGTYFCTAALQVAEKNLPGLMMQMAYAGLEGADRRVSRRLHCKVRILSKELSNFQAVTTNINKTGAELQTDGPVLPGSFMNLQFDLETVGVPELTLQAQAIWCLEKPNDGGRTKYRVGVVFPRQHPQSHDAWERFYMQLRGAEGASVMHKTLDGGSITEAPNRDREAAGSPSRLPQPDTASESGRFTRPPLPTEASDSGRWSMPQMPQPPAPPSSPQPSSESGRWSPPAPPSSPQPSSDSGRWKPPGASQPFQMPQPSQMPPAPQPTHSSTESGRWSPPPAMEAPKVEIFADERAPQLPPGGFQLPPISQAVGFEFPSAPAQPELVEPMGIKGAEIAFRSRDSWKSANLGNRLIRLSFTFEGQVSTVDVNVNVLRAEPMPDGTRICWGTVLEDEEKIRVFNQLLGS